MPRACPVEAHVCYEESLPNSSGCHGLAPWRFTLAPTKRRRNLPDATGLSRGASRLLLQKALSKFLSGCHGLVPWRLTFAATKKACRTLPDATGLSRGGSRLQLQKALSNFLSGCHGLVPWRLSLLLQRKLAELFRMPTGLHPWRLTVTDTRTPVSRRRHLLKAV
jgi:hypothetical protein